MSSCLQKNSAIKNVFPGKGLNTSINIKPVHFSTSPIRPTEDFSRERVYKHWDSLSHIHLHSQTILGSINQLDTVYPKPQQKKKSPFYKPIFFKVNYHFEKCYLFEDLNLSFTSKLLRLLLNGVSYCC